MWEVEERTVDPVVTVRAEWLLKIRNKLSEMQAVVARGQALSINEAMTIADQLNDVVFSMDAVIDSQVKTEKRPRRPVRSGEDRSVSR